MSHNKEIDIMHACIDATVTGVVVVAPVLLYTKQLLMIKNSGETGSFSPFVSCVIIFTSCFRALYYYGHRYEESILYQGLALLIVHIALLHIYVNTKNAEDNVQKLPQESVFDISKIWSWRRFSKYMQFVVLIIFMYVNFFFLTYSPTTIQITGVIANILDGSVSLPQLIANFRKGYIKNLR